MKILRAIGKSLCYFMVYFTLQGIATGAALVFKIPEMIKNGVFDAFKDGGPLTQKEKTDFINSFLNAIVDVTMPAMIVSAVLTILLYILSSRLKGRKFSEEVRLGKPSLIALPAVILFGASINILISYALSLLESQGSMKHFFEDYENATSFLNVEISVISVLAVAVFGPIVEEILFRGYIYGSFREAFSGKVTKVIIPMIIQGVVFAFAHGSVIGLIYTFPLGIIMALILDRFDSLYMSMAFHMAFNATSFADTLLNGLEGAPLIIVLSVCTVVALASMFLIWFGKYEKKPKTPANA